MPAIDAQAVSQPWRRHPPGLPPSRHTLNAASRKDCHLRAGHLRAPPSARPRSGGRPVTWRARMTVRRVRHLPAVSLSCLAVLSRQARAERAGRTGRTCRPRQPRASPCTLASRVRWPAGYSGQPGTVTSRADTAGSGASWFPGLMRHWHFQRSCPSSSSEPAIRAETTGAPCSSMARFAVHLKG